MKRLYLRVLIAVLLVVAIVLASTQRPESYYPSVDLEVPQEPTQFPGGPLTVSFLFNGETTLRSCEALTGHIARVIFKSCPQCRVKNILCSSALDESQRELLSNIPLSTPSGRMPNGVAVFNANTPELALAACQASEAQSSTSKIPVKCFSANTPRSRPSVPFALGLWDLVLLFFAVASAWLTGWLILKYEHLHAHISHDPVVGGPQKYHTEPTPRIGGLVLMVGLLISGGVMLLDSVPGERELGLILLASAPAFLGGLIEDLTKQVGVLKRLLLTMLSGAIAAWLLGAVLRRLDIPGVDQALHWLPFAVMFTSFAVGGIANAINIIDGYNGVAAGLAIVVLAAIGYVATQVGDYLVFATALGLAGSLLGFLAWNWPSGKMFLGDGGAYLLGFMLAELSVLLVTRNPDVSPWFPLALMIYPVFETCFSVFRKLKKGLSPGRPDSEHLHHLVYQKLALPSVRLTFPPVGLAANNRVAKYILMGPAVTSLLCAWFWQSKPMLAGIALAYCLAYIITYRRLIKRPIG